MPYRDTDTLATRTQIQLRFVKRSAKLVNALQCLIISADVDRRSVFERAAVDGGWKTLQCADAPTALNYINRSLVQLAIIDLEKQSAELFRPVVERLTSTKGVLVIVCGNEGDVREEVWARQLGAWLYLPAVEPANFTLLCGEARQIAERLCKGAHAERASSLPQGTS